jgi:hypothetical protein
MDLLIRSQNRLKLIKVNGTISIEHSLEPDKNDYQIFVGLTYIGAYKNEERALEVLDEIQKLLTMQRISIPTHNCNDTKHIYKDELTNYVYEMPKE